MHRIEGQDYDSSTGVNLFTEGPPGTVVTEEFMNAIQEELALLVATSGQTLKTEATDTRNQLLASLLVGKFYYADASEADQGVAATGDYKTIKDCADEIGTDKAQIVLVNSGATETYNLLTNLTLGSNIELKPLPGALVKPAASVKLTTESPEHIKASPNQQIIDMSLNDSTPLGFTKGGKAHPGWLKENTVPGTTDMTEAGQVIINALSTAGGGVMELQPEGYSANWMAKDYVHIKGMGRYKSIITPEDLNEHVVYNSGDEIRGFEMSHLMIDANGQDASHDCINIETKNNLMNFTDLHITRAGRHGIYIDGKRTVAGISPLPGTSVNGGRWNRITNCDFMECGLDGLYIYRSTAPNIFGVRSAIHGWDGSKYAGYGMQLVYSIEANVPFFECWYCGIGLHIKGDFLSSYGTLKIDNWTQYALFVEGNDADGQKVENTTIVNLIGQSDSIAVDDNDPAIYVKSTATYSVEHLNIHSINFQTPVGDNVPSLALYEDNSGGAGIIHNSYHFTKIWWGASAEEAVEISIADPTTTKVTVDSRQNGGTLQVGQIPTVDLLVSASGSMLSYGVSKVDSSGGAVNLTLGGGVQTGHRKMVVMTDATNASTFTITNHIDGDGGTYTLNAVGEGFELVWVVDQWVEAFTFGSVTYVP